MTIEKLQDAIRADPFIPFTVRMGDGRSFNVPHRDFISYSPVGRTVIVYGNRGRFSILDLLLMTELEMEDHPRVEARGGLAS